MTRHARAYRHQAYRRLLADTRLDDERTGLDRLGGRRLFFEFVAVMVAGSVLALGLGGAYVAAWAGK